MSKVRLQINTINGGGGETLIRLSNSLDRIKPELNKHFIWNWNIVSQGPFGTGIDQLKNIIKKHGNVTPLFYPRNIGTTWATNELIDLSKERDFDVFWMIDDDIEIIKSNFVQLMMERILRGEKKTSCDVQCVFGRNRPKLKEQGVHIGTLDHGSGCTMYAREIYDKVGYHDEDIIQYAHDTEFNHRIKSAYGRHCLGIYTGEICNHYNQTATRKNFVNTISFGFVMKTDTDHLKTKNYKEPYLDRVYFKKPLYTSNSVIKVKL